METNLPVIAGVILSTIFTLSNVGNIIHSIYIFHLPAGPIWLLHSFCLVSTGLMLVWYLRYEWQSSARV
jgi:hypothetical protein